MPADFAFAIGLLRFRQGYPPGELFVREALAGAGRDWQDRPGPPKCPFAGPKPAGGVWSIHDAARLRANAERFQMVEGTANGMTGSDDRLTVCDVSLKGSALVLAIDRSAAELCQIPDGTRVRACGFLRDGRLEVSHPLNLKVRD